MLQLPWINAFTKKANPAADTAAEIAIVDGII